MSTVTVSIPCWNSPGTIRRAVDAVLNQTHKDLLCIVIDDGSDLSNSPWPALEDIKDSRLIRFSLPSNRGRYFADAVALQSCSTEFWTTHDADDEARPSWIATQLSTLKRHKADAVFCTHAVHGLTTKIARMERPKDFTGAFTFYAHMAGLWKTDFIRSLGGPRPDFRLGYDTMLTGAAMATGRVRLYRGVLYDRYLQPTSLTKSPGTRIGSPARKQSKDWMERRWPRVVRAAKVSPDAAGNILLRDIPDHIVEDVRSQSQSLRRLITGPSKARTTAMPTSSTRSPRWATILNDKALWGSWALNLDTGRTLARELETRRPRVILEAGSGTSTVLFSQYADQYDAQVISLESSEEFRSKTRQLLRERGTGSRVDVRYAPLHKTADGPWYTSELPEKIDLAIVDGPRAKDGGRLAAMRYLMPRMTPGSVVILDDTDRDKEQSDLHEWSRRYGMNFMFLPGSNRTASYAVLPEVDAKNTGGAKVAITLLTGRRPDHLDDTLGRLQVCAPGLLSRAYVIALHNGGDAKTVKVLNKYSKVIDVRWTSSVLHSIGDATSVLAQQAMVSGRRYWLHLEDDWSLIPTTSDWLAKAQHILHTRREVYQVRLRHVAEKTLAKHMVTNKALHWYDYRDFHLARDVHYTLNPSLMRTQDIPKVWPAEGERAAQKKAHMNRLRQVARLSPGVFVHTGEANSLRSVTRCTA